ncbi:MAG: type II secretion system F family protein [Sphingomonadaceae bacterium]|nr:type II secretion system F family protein [Sphingomonadaceae bacterium]
MPTYRYRAAGPQGLPKIGMIEAGSRAEALSRLRAEGLAPIEAVETGARKAAAAADGQRARGGDRRSATRAIGELGVLIGAGLTLDRALSVVAETATRPAARAAFAAMLKRVKEGAPLSRALGEAPPGLLPPSAAAMAEAGEANGRLDVALVRLADALERAEKLRETIISSLIYPALLIAVAIAVIGVMLFVVVPQFETLLAGANRAALPASTLALIGASQVARAEGPAVLTALALAAIVLWRALKRPAMRARLDRRVLELPVVGTIVRDAETARFARVLGSLIEGGVPVPQALAIARRSIANAHIAAAVERVGTGLKRGGGLTAPLAAAGVFPKLAISFLRTGEETARLGPMLDKLADVLDAEVRQKTARAIGLLTPLLTIAIGLFIGLVIASLITAILGFNQLALGPA